MTRFTALITALLVASANVAFANPAPQSSGPPCPAPQCISSPNNCDITAPCSSFGSKLYCGCRPGYKATGISDYETSKQFRITVLRGHEHRVWVAPGVKCNTLCQFPFGTNPCGEVAIANQCFAR